MPIKLTNKEFLDKAKKTYPSYDFKNTVYTSKRNKLNYTCNESHEISQLPANLLKCGCPICSRNSYTTESYIQSAKEKYAHLDYTNTVYVNNKTKISFECKIHGIKEQLPLKHLKTGCLECKGFKLTHWDTDRFITEAKKLHKKYRYDATVYKDMNSRVVVHCEIHGNFLITPFAHINLKQGCKQCGYANRKIPHKKTTEEIIVKFKNKWHELYDYTLTKYKNNKTHIYCKCNNCNRIIRQLPKAHLKSGCYFCNGRGIPKHTVETFLEASRQIHGDKFKYHNVAKLDNIRDRIIINCEKHGEFEQLAYRHLQTTCPCPTCCAERSSSLKEKEVLSYIQSIYSKSILENDRKVLAGKEIDVYLPDVKIGFEFHGMWFHTETIVGRNYHLTKANLANEAGIQLVQIYEFEWDNKQDIVKSVISNLLGKNRRIYARNTKVVELSRIDKSHFLKSNHLQGSDSSSTVYFGLMNENEIVAVMTFGKSRFNKNYDWELTRFSSKSGINVIGGASKLLKHFLKYHTGSIITYADRRFSNGNMYSKLGFKLDGVVPPGFLYYDLQYKTTCHRMKFQRHKLKNLPHYDEKLSAYEIMRLNGFDRIWNAGNLRFVLNSCSASC